jgi:hypothetical protein
MKSYREQLDRLLRSYERFRHIDEGRRHNMTSADYEDEVYAYFMNCYHLKDWLINDPDFSASSRDVESYINNNKELQICGDICNAHKHLVLNRPRSEEDPIFGAKKIHLHLGGGEAELKIKFTIDTTSGLLDAFELATKCLELWKTFIAENGGAV